MRGNMITVDHEHTEETPFSGPSNAAVFVCQHVLNGEPVELVCHDADGDWQFICAGAHDYDDASQVAVMCLGCVVRAHPDVVAVAAMAPGYEALRSAGWTPVQVVPS